LRKYSSRNSLDARVYSTLYDTVGYRMLPYCQKQLGYRTVWAVHPVCPFDKTDLCGFAICVLLGKNDVELSFTFHCSVDAVMCDTNRSAFILNQFGAICGHLQFLFANVDLGCGPMG
jgi:hypothetical protein